MKQKQIKFGILFVLILLAGLIFPTAVEAQTGVTLGISPAATNACGEIELSVDVAGVLESQPMTGFYLELTFPKTQLQVISVESGGFLLDPLMGTPDNIIANANESGRLKWGYVQQATGGVNTPQFGGGSLLKIKFAPVTAVVDATVTIDADESMLIDWPNVFPIPFSVTNAATVKLNALVTNTNTEKLYCDLETAISEATTTDYTLQMLGDLTTNKAYTIDKKLTLNTNGKTITRTGAGMVGTGFFTVSPGGDLTITGAGSILSETSGQNVIEINGGTVAAKATLSNATLKAGNLGVLVIGKTDPGTFNTPYPASFVMTGGSITSGSAGAYPRGNGAEVAISGGSIKGGPAVSGNGTLNATNNYGGTKITISGGTIEGFYNGGIDTAVYHPQVGELIITGGTITGDVAVEMKAGNLSIGGTAVLNGGGVYVEDEDIVKSGGASTNTGDAILIYSRDGYGAGLPINVTITGGTINGVNGHALREFTYAGETSRLGTVEISGGRFTGATGKEAVVFTTLDPDEDKLVLTDGAYSTDPAEYVYYPYATYEDTDDYFRILINHRPELETIEDATISEMVAYDFTATATDVEDDELTFSLVSAPAGASIGATTGVFGWTPSEAQGPGVYPFTVKVCDDETPALCDEQDVTLTVEEVNLPPVLAEIGDKSVFALSELTFTATASDPDLPVNTLTFSLDDAPAGSTMTAGGAFSWTPTKSQKGEHEFDVCVSDGDLSDCETITITVTVKNTLDEEIESAIDYEYVPEYIPVGESEFDPADNTFIGTYKAPQVLAGGPMNDLARYLGALYRQDGSTITSIVFDGTTYTWDTTGTLAGSNWEDSTGKTLISVVTAKFQAEVLAETWTTEPGYTMTVHDDYGHQASVTFKMIILNSLDAEIASAPLYVYSDYSYVGTSIFDDNTNTYTSTYTDQNFEGGESAMNDLARYLGALYRQNGSTVAAITYDGKTYTWDPDGTLKGSNWVDGTGKTLIKAISDKYQALELDLEAGLTLTLRDGFHTETVTFKFVVSDTTAPTVSGATAIGASGFSNVDAVEMVITVDQGYTVAKTEISVNEAVTVVANTEVSLAGVPYGLLTVDTTGKILTATPYPGNEVASLVGEFIFSIPTGSVKDLAGNPLETLSLKLIVLNVAPLADGDAYTVNEDETLNVAAPGVLANDTDYPGTILTAEWVSGPANGTVDLKADGSFVYTPAANFNGTDSFTYTANDGDLSSTAATVTITITVVNDAPVLTTIPNATIPEMVASGFTATATDVEDDELTFSLVSAPAGASMTEAGVFSWTPSEAQGPGVYSFTVKVCDDGTPALCDEQDVTLTVTEVNLPPVLAEIGDKSVFALSELTFTATASDPDLPANSLSFSLVGAPAGSTMTAGGAFSWTPTKDQSGEHEFDVCVSDGDLSDCETITVTVTVKNTLDEEIESAIDYEYVPEYIPVGESEFDPADNTFIGTYKAPQVLAGGPMNDLARYLGALYRQDDSTITSIVFDGTTYTWDTTGTLAGSNWEDENGITLVSVVTAKFQAEVLAETWATEPGYTMTVHDDYDHSSTVTFKMIILNTLDDELESAPAYVYTPVYTYVGTWAFADPTNIYTLTYDDTNFAPGAMNDLARYLGALYRQAISTVATIEYDGVVYTWQVIGDELKGSNWRDASGTTLISVITADVIAGEIDPETGLILTLSDVFHTENVTFKLMVNDTTAPELEEVTPTKGSSLLFGPGENFVLTVDAKDDNLYSLEVDHSMESTLDEFTVYASATNPYGDEATKALFEAQGVFVTYNATTQTWTIDFGAAVTKAIADNGGITFYLVLEDESGNEWGSMDPVTAENTFTYTVAQDLVAPTVSGVTAIGAEGFADVDAAEMTITVDEGYKVSTIVITMSEPVAVALGTQVTINPQAAVYGTVTAVNGAVITITPAVGNETASVVGTFTFTVPTGSVEDLAGNAWLNVPISLVVQDVTAPTIVSGEAIGATGFDDVTMVGTTFTVPQGYTVEKIEFTMSETVQIVAPGIVYHEGNPYGTMSASGSVVTVTPYAGNEVAWIPGNFTFTIDAGSILDMSGNELGTLTATMAVEASPIFNITDFGPWGTTWPGAYNLGWGYVPLFDTTTIAKIEVGMLDADRKSIVSYTAEDEQIVWQRDNGYITAAKLSSAPFYRVYNGNPLAEGIDDDWTVIFGEAFDAWSPRWGYVRVTDSHGTVVYREIEYTGTLGDLTVPEIDEAVAVGVDPFDDVTADELTFTVPQGYTVEKIEFTMSEAVTVVAGTEVSLAGVPYGSITADGTLITVTPYPSNTVANLIGTFVFNVPDGKIFDISGNPLGTLSATMIVTNVAPVAVADTYTMAEDGVLTIEAPGVLDNDTDFDVSVLTAVLEDEPSHGSLSLNANGGFTYTPDANFNGTDIFTYKAFDGEDYSDETTVTITVTAVNDAPVAVNDTYSTSFEKELIIIAPGVLDNDSDVDDDDITAILVANVNNGSLTLAADGSFTYTPNTGFSGVDTFTYKANDGKLDSITATVSITVTAYANTPPVAVDDEYETDENVELVVPVPGVLDNDYDIDGDNLTATLKTNVTNGTLVLLDDGSFTYMPKADFCGTDSFVYTLVSYPGITAGDDGWTADATATITVYCDAKISSSNLAGPFYIGNLQEFQVRLENPAPGHVYGSLAASIFVDGITAADFSSVEVIHPSTGTWVPLTPVVDGDGMRIDLGPIATIPLTSGFDQTLSFRVNFNTPGKYPVTGTLYDGAIDPTKVIATHSDEMVVAGLLAQDFGYFYQSDVLGVTAGFGNVNFDLSQAMEIKVELFTGSAPDYVLLQTNTAVDPDLMATWTQFSSPFDIFGSFDYTADGYWDNVRAAEYGQTAIPSRVLATITLPDGITLTAENKNLTGERGYILDTLDEEIASAPNYPYDPAYVPVGPSTFDPADNTYTSTYTAPQVLAGGPMNDLARYLGALYRQSSSTITSIVFDETTYTWDTTGTLAGSNWEDSTGKTLISVVTAKFQAEVQAETWATEPGYTMIVHDDYGHQANVTFKMIILNTLDDELESAPAYVYTPVYTYVGSWAFADPTNIYTLTYDDTNFAPGAMNDMARYLGALYRQTGSTVATITYDGTTYSWDPDGTLKGSNWVDASGTTLVSVITADVIAGEIDPETGLILTLSDVFHTENVTFKLVVNDTIAPELEEVSPSKGSSLLFGPGENFVLTVDAKDDNLYSLEVDHSMESTLDEFTVYASATNPYGDEATKALFEAQGVFVTYNATTQTWTIDFGAAVTKAIADNGGITFYLVLEDESGNEWGSMDPVTAENTFAYTIAQDLVAPTVSGATAIGASGFGNVEAVEMVITVDQGYTVAKTEISLNEAVTVVANTEVSLAGVPYGLLTVDTTGKILTATPYPGNEVASLVGEFIFAIPTGSVKDLAGNPLETLSLKLIVLNVAPLADDDTYTFNEDETLNVAAPGVLANDTDYPGTTLTAEWVSGPANGTLDLKADGSFDYTPAANFNGTDSFTYTANDGDLSSTAATVMITVNPVNDAPVAQDQTVTTAEDTAKEITLVATDADSDPLTYTVVAGPTNGTLSGTAPNLTYTPNANFHGTDSFTFKANDSTIDSNIATISITVTPVNDAPVAEDQSVTTDEDTAKEITLVATDADGDSLTYTVVAGPTNGTLSGIAPNLTYTPNANFHGTDSFTFKANDGTVDSNTATVDIIVTSVNDIPVAQDQEVTTLEDTAKEIILVATDADGDPLTYTVVADPTNGTLSGTAPNLTYTPNANFHGTDTFTFKVNDGTVDSNTATVTITVTAVNDAPVLATIPNATIPELVPFSFTATASDVDSVNLTFNMNGAPEGTGMTYLGVFSWTPSETQGPGVYTFTVSVCDDGTPALCDEQEVTLTVQEVNTAPALGGISDRTVVALTELEFTATAADDDLPANTLTFSLLGAPAGATIDATSGEFSWTPTDLQVGEHDFEICVNDGTVTVCEEITITVTARNLAPVAENQSVTTDEDTAIAITLVANDADGDPLTYTVVAGPTNGVLTGTAPNLTYTPNANYSGPDSFTFKANDGTIDSNTATVTIAVTAVNDAPVAQDQTVTTDEDTAIAITLVATDVDNTTLTYSIVAGPGKGTLSTLSGNQVTYTPNKDYNGTDSFTFKANDGTLDSNTATVTINISPVNDAPVAVDDKYTMVEDEILTIAAPGILANDLDDGSSLTAVLVDTVSHGKLTLTADGSFTYTPNEHFNGKDSFTYKANDGVLASNLAVVEITVTPVNDWVIANDDAYETLTDVTLVVDAEDGVLANDVLLDPDETVSIEIRRAPENGTLVMNNDGSFTFVPKQGFWGRVTFEYRVHSEQKAGEFFDDATVTILVKPHRAIYLPLMFVNR